MSKEIKWLDEPERHNYPAAESYLSLIFPTMVVEKMVNDLEFQSERISFKAKDILRASGLQLLPENNERIQSNKEKIKDEKSLSPMLLVRDTENRKVIVADGYHRLCTLYTHDENSLIPCRII